MWFFSLPADEEKEKNNISETKTEDFVLAKDASNGDVNAFEKIVRKYEKYVCAVVYSVLRDREETFDASQEVFLKLYHSIGSFKGESSFSSWLYRIAKNCALDFARKKKERPLSLTVRGDDDDDSKVLDVSDDSEKNNPEKALIIKERKTLLYEAISELSDEHREIIILRDINGYSYSEISDMLSLEEGTVKSRLFRARSALREKLIAKNYFQRNFL
ncbi:MAG: sigma-70 family RNA polymerase sigma factor [Clostridia bacterium]|nr:sigma-70 family RNA polymerase sigma factor [Clostridia bacterium]